MVGNLDHARGITFVIGHVPLQGNVGKESRCDEPRVVEDELYVNVLGSVNNRRHVVAATKVHANLGVNENTVCVCVCVCGGATREIKHSNKRGAT